ncbi:copper chaperone for superoxide dismutase isoform X2 [Rhodnius prolixus]|uniref:Extracellular superoxide dismutase [Cu-Zn] n=3 Tax=Rhodnius TaxID=13248 RepID=A0A0P4VXF6_9HEMI
MKCQSCADKIKSNLQDSEGIDSVKVSFDKGIVLVKTSLPSSVIKEKLEAEGNIAVLNGYGNEVGEINRTTVTGPSTSAVAMVGGNVGYSSSKIQGVIRFIQANEVCVIDGTIDGLSPGLHGLHIHECGDISKGCESVGDHFDLKGNRRHGGPEDDDNNRHTGDLGNIKAGDNGRAVFRFKDQLLKVWDIIGRSVVVTENQDDLGKGQHPLSVINGNSGSRLACGIISRSAGLFENTKKICACDGVTIWDERNKPLAGPGRRTVSDKQHSTPQACSAF